MVLGSVILLAVICFGGTGAVLITRGLNSDAIAAVFPIGLGLFWVYCIYPIVRSGREIEPAWLRLRDSGLEVGLVDGQSLPFPWLGGAGLIKVQKLNKSIENPKSGAYLSVPHRLRHFVIGQSFADAIVDSGRRSGALVATKKDYVRHAGPAMAFILRG